MSKPCKILCCKCGKPLLYDWQDIRYKEPSEPKLENMVYVSCRRKGCKHLNTNPLFNLSFNRGFAYGREDAKKEIRKAIGVAKDNCL